ncbi:MULTISPECIES: Uma2 family endonuclease [unclassified Synechococcus]|uniref:Uma2 family endonuclease n=1 Tax=unclassified Synechococcus TaxID=2626047 RepID=UPI0020CD0E59|nr:MULTISPECIES: Uma2 family endonuclease [unclassified Synechococcus]
MVFDSSSGFRLPDGSVLSPDASMVQLERWESLTPMQRLGFAPVCPEQVVELASPSEGGPPCATGWQRIGRRGAILGWLLLPHEQAVEVFYARVEPQHLEKLEVQEAGAEFPGLRLEPPIRPCPMMRRLSMKHWKRP